jgi:RNA polymerase sigma-70 factor (ECF subfamily)
MIVLKSDATLIQEVLSGDGDAFGSLVARYQQSVFTLVGSMVHDLDAAEDITQEAFIAAYTQLPELRDSRRFTAWLRKIATNTARMWQRKHSDSKSRGTVDQEISLETGDRGLNEVISKVLASLPETKRQVAILCYMDGFSRKDVARFLGVPESTLRKRLFDTKRVLQRRIVEAVEKNLEEHLLPKNFAQQCVCACKRARQKKTEARKEVPAMRANKDSKKKDCGCGCLPKGKTKTKNPPKKKRRA